MGLTSWEGAPQGKIHRYDVVVAKNYLTEDELQALGRIVNAYLDLAEVQATRHIPMTMADWEQRLNGFLTLWDAEILQDAGRVSAELAKAKAETAWNAFKNRIEGINVYFENSKTVPAISDEDKAAIDELCAFLKDNKEYKVVVIGHTDSYGDPEQNLHIWGMQRAEALRDYMVKQGAPAEQIRCESKGQNEPIAPNDSRANRALNRRANIRFE